MSNLVECFHCGHMNRASARYCAQCGKSLADKTTVEAPKQPHDNPPPVVAEMHWQRRPGEVAARITASSLGNDSRGRIIIEDGLAALAFRNGQMVEHIPPGPYPVERFASGWFSRGKDTVVYLVDTAELHMAFDMDGLWTMDPLRLKAACELVVRVKEAGRFCRMLVKDKSTYRIDDLQALLMPEVRDAAQVYLADHSMEQLESNIAARREDFAVDVRERMRAQLENIGLEFQRVRFFNLRHPRFDQLKQQEEELFLGPAELDYQKRLFDVYNEAQLHEIAKENAEAAQFEERAAVWERMRRAVQGDRLNEATSNEEWSKFVAEADKRRLVSEDELIRFREDLRWKGEDRNSERAHTLAMAGLYAEFERKSAEVAEQFKFDQNRLQNELFTLKQNVLGRLEIEREQIHLQQELETLQAAQRREQAHLDDMAAREKLLEDAINKRQVELETTQSMAERRRIEISIEALEVEQDLIHAEQAMAMLRRNREEKFRIDREHSIAVRNAQLADEERRFRMQMEAKKTEREHELMRMDKLAGLSVEALISVTDDQGRAQLIAELKRTAQFKDMSEEQILAMTAERQPLVIEAMKARYQAAADGRLSTAEMEKWKALTEAAQQNKSDLTSAMQDSLSRQERSAREAAERQERAASEAMRNVSDVAKSFAQRPEGSPTIIYGPGSSTDTGRGAGSGTGSTSTEKENQVVVCPKCQIRSAAGTKYCSHCGWQFYS